MVTVMLILYLIILILPLIMVLRLHYDSRITHITYGCVMIEFSKIDKICYFISLLCLIAGISLGISMIWFEDISNIGTKLVGTLGLVLLLCIGVVVINRLIRASGRYTEK